MIRKKVIVLIVILSFTTSTTVIGLSPLGLIDRGVILQQPTVKTASDSPDLDPNAALFLNTHWDNPLTQEQAALIEYKSMDDLYSEPESHVYTTPSQISDDSNGTDCAPQIYPGDELSVSDASTKSLDDSGWPWQPLLSTRDDFPALPTAPVMEGRWWPKKSYSTLSFDIEIDTPITDNLYIWAWIVRDQDSYSRFLTFWFDNNFVQQSVITSLGFKTSVYVPASKIDNSLTRHRVEISINYCGYVDQGWKLLYGWVGNGTGPNGDQQTPPMDSNGFPYPMNELTPRTGQTHCVMEFDVLAGEYTLLNIQTENVADTTRRSVYVYFENSGGTYSFKGWISCPGSYQVYLGEHTDNVHRKLKLVFRYMPDIDYAKRIKQLCVTHVGWNLEVDYMLNTPITTLASQITSMNAYYKTHSYHYVTYTTSQDLPVDSETTLSEHYSYYLDYFDHIGQAKWEYVIYVESLDPDYAGYLYALHIYGIRIYNYGIAINADHCHMNYVIWHEYGHHIYISVPFWGPEDYCDTPECIMSTSAGEGWYCFYHFLQRRTL